MHQWSHLSPRTLLQALSALAERRDRRRTARAETPSDPAPATPPPAAPPEHGAG